MPNFDLNKGSISMPLYSAVRSEAVSHDRRLRVEDCPSVHCGTAIAATAVFCETTIRQLPRRRS
jgi:hypothetical protein